jgi:hypothetical protein
MIQIEELTPGGRRVKALSPSPVIDLRNTLAGEARATRTRQLATPSWLSTRTKPIIERRAGPFAPSPRPWSASSIWSLLPRREGSVFSPAPCAGAVAKQAARCGDASRSRGAAESHARTRLVDHDAWRMRPRRP